MRLESGVEPAGRFPRHFHRLGEEEGRAMLLNSDLLDQLAIKTDAKMIFLVMDGLGGMECRRRRE